MSAGTQLLAGLREHFTDVHFRWSPLVPTGPVRLSAELGEDLDRASQRLLTLLRRMALDFGESAAARDRRLGIDDRLRALHQDEEIERRYATVLARPDAILTAEGWRFLEFNVSASVGGQTYVDLFNSYWCGRGTEDLRLRSPLEDRNALLHRIIDDLGVPRRVAVIGCAEDIHLIHPRYYDHEVDILRAGGIDATYREPAEYLAGLDAGEPAASLVLQRFVPQDWLDKGRDLAQAARLAEGGAIVLAPASSEHVANKRTFAALSAEPDWLDEDEREFVRRYVPWTREVHDTDVDWDGRQKSLPHLLRKEREHLVLKRSDGNGGHGIHVGRAHDPAEWDRLIAVALSAGTWVAQRVVDPVGIPVDVMDPSTLRCLRIEAPAVFGPVIVGGVASGCMVRFDTAGLPGADVIVLSEPTVLLNTAAWPAG